MTRESRDASATSRSMPERFPRQLQERREGQRGPLRREFGPHPLLARPLARKCPVCLRAGSAQGVNPCTGWGPYVFGHGDTVRRGPGGVCLPAGELDGTLAARWSSTAPRTARTSTHKGGAPERVTSGNINAESGELDDSTPADRPMVRDLWNWYAGVRFHPSFGSLAPRFGDGFPGRDHLHPPRGREHRSSLVPRADVGVLRCSANRPACPELHRDSPRNSPRISSSRRSNYTDGTVQ